MDYEKLKEVIAKQIKENGQREITGPVLQAVLMAMVDSLGEVYPQTYTDEEKAQARANIDALSNHNGEITKEKLSLEVQAILNDVANKQNISDATLATIAKTIVGAINEVYKGGLEDASIATSKIKDGAVTDAKIANGAVTTPKIANDAVTTEKVNDGAITEPKLDTDLVNIITSAVQPAELASAIATALTSYVAKADIVDTTGSATDKVMSQHGVTEAIDVVTNKVTELEPQVTSLCTIVGVEKKTMTIGDFNNATGDIVARDRTRATLEIERRTYKSFWVATGYKYVLYGNDSGIGYPTTPIVSVWSDGLYDITDLPYVYLFIKVKKNDGTEFTNEDANNAVTLLKAETGLVQKVETISKELNSLSKKLSTIYVSTNGDDSNSGTKDNPLKTITKALSFNPSTILVRKGVYSERLNIYDADGLTIAVVNEDFSQPNYDDKFELDGLGTRPLLMYLEGCNNITLIGVKVKSYTASGFRLKSCSNVKMMNCESSSMVGSYQFGIGFELINTDGEFVNCVAHDVSLDGFNIHGFGCTTFKDCVAYNCGDDGISHHDACVGSVIGGEYYNNGKGGVSSPTYGAKINIDGVYCHNNLFGIYTAMDSNGRQCEAQVRNCVLKNNTSKDLLVNGARIIAWNNIYDTKNVTSNGELVEY